MTNLKKKKMMMKTHVFKLRLLVVDVLHEDGDGRLARARERPPGIHGLDLKLGFQTDGQERKKKSNWHPEVLGWTCRETIHSISRGAPDVQPGNAALPSSSRVGRRHLAIFFFPLHTQTKIVGASCFTK